jgi:hypothetical protein
MRKVIFCGKAEEGCGVNAAYFGAKKRDDSRMSWK